MLGNWPLACDTNCKYFCQVTLCLLALILLGSSCVVLHSTQHGAGPSATLSWGRGSHKSLEDQIMPKNRAGKFLLAVDSANSPGAA